MHNTPLKQIRLIVRSDEEDGQEFMIEDRGGGVDIRGAKKPLLESDRCETMDLSVGHCPSCYGGDSILGLSDDEWEDLKQWRKRKERGVTTKRMGEILDKLIMHVAEQANCGGIEHRIVLKVESDA